MCMSVVFLLPLTEKVLNKTMGVGLGLLALVLPLGLIFLKICKRDKYDYFTFFSL